MKKIISLLTAVLMFALLIPSAGAEESVASYERILLSGENFDVPSYAGGGYTINEGTASNNLFKKTIKINGGDINNYSIAEVYIATGGTYNLWVLHGNAVLETTTNFSDRKATVQVDDLDKVTLTAQTGHAWEKTTWTLGAGWHTLKIGMSVAWAPAHVNALYLTNDAEYVPDKDNQNMLRVYADATAPSFAADAEVAVSYEGGAVNLTFPAATDKNGVVAYKYSVNGGEDISVLDISAPVVLSGLAGKTALTLKAYDKYGNCAEKSFSISVPKTKWMLTYHNFTLPDIAQCMITNENSNALANYLTTEHKHLKLNNAQATDVAETLIYVEVEGDYAIWLLSGSVSNDSNRFPKAGFDGGFNKDKCNETYALSWKKCGGASEGSTSWHLTKGWHSLQLGLGTAGYNPTNFNAVYITSDLAEQVTFDNDKTLLSSYMENSVLYNGKKYGTTGLELEGVVVEDDSINLAPVKGGTTAADATVTVNGTSAAWEEEFMVNLQKGVNTVNISSSDSKVKCSIPVVSLGSVVHHTAAAITGSTAESAFAGADGTSKAVYISGSGSSAKFYADGISGKADVYVYAIGAAADSSAADSVNVKLKDVSGETNGTAFSNNTAASGWVKIGSCRFSGKDDRSEYVEIAGQDGKNVYFDSVKFVYTNEYIFSNVDFISDNGNVKAVFSCYKQSENSAEPAVVLAQYDSETDALIGAEKETVLFDGKGISQITTAKSVAARENSYYKLFIWDSLDSLKPLAKALSK